MNGGTRGRDSLLTKESSIYLLLRVHSGGWGVGRFRNSLRAERELSSHKGRCTLIHWLLTTWRSTGTLGEMGGEIERHTDRHTNIQTHTQTDAPETSFPNETIVPAIFQSKLKGYKTKSQEMDSG